jgi:secondary thiamine-phosphate synthase enzyme
MITLSLTSREKTQMLDISSEVCKTIYATGVNQGIAVVYTPHTTAAITINENADPDVSKDLLMGMSKLAPQDDNYLHIEGNSAAHILSSLLGPSETLLIENGQPVLGTWQGIFFCEFDGPRQRQVHIQVVAS